MTKDISETDLEVDALNALDLEYRLTIAHRVECWCSIYLAERRAILLPEILHVVMTRGLDPEDFFHEFSEKLHETKCPSMPQPQPFWDRVIKEIRDTMVDSEWP